MKRALLVCLVIGCRPAPPDHAAVLHEVRIAAADGRDFERAVELAWQRFDEHFRVRMSRVDGVSDRLFSAKWKCRAIFWRDPEYRKALERLLDGKLFDGMPELMVAISADLAAAAEASDNRLMMFVGTRTSAIVPALDAVALRRDYLEGLAVVARQDAEINLLSLAYGDVAAAMVMAGLASAWWTLGAGMAAGVAAGIAVEVFCGDAIEKATRGSIESNLLIFRMEARRKIGEAVESAVQRYLRAREEAIVHAVEQRLA